MPIHGREESPEPADPVGWLLASGEPAIRRLVRQDLLDMSDPESTDDVLAGPLVRGLFAGQRADGGFGNHPYAKWTGSFWRVIALVELGVPTGEPRAVAAARHAVGWVTSPDRHAGAGMVAGRERRHAAHEGLMVGVCVRLGLAAEPTSALMARQLVEWQWPDGGWNCDPRPAARHSSFHESIWPAWGLWEYARATGDGESRRAALRTAELVLSRRVFRSRRTGDIVHPSWASLHYPPYWHYDVLAALLVLGRMGMLGDPRCTDALDLLERRRLRDGRWRPGGYWWKPPGGDGSGVEAVDWGRGGPNEMITLNALRVLCGAGRIDPRHPS